MFVIEKKGDLNIRWLGKCSDCGAMISCNISDLKNEKIEIFINGMRKYTRFNCLHCKGQSTVVAYEENSDDYVRLNNELRNKKRNHGIKC